MTLKALRRPAIRLDLRILIFENRFAPPTRRQVQTKLFTFCILSFASAASREDFKTVNGKEYKDATVTRVEPDGIVVKTKSGITKVYFTELPKDVQEHFHYDSGKPPRILPSRPPITPHIKSNRRKPDVNNRPATQKTTRR